MRKSIVLAVVIGALMSISATALAQTDAGDDPASTDRYGRLWAYGSGTADLDVDRGVVKLWIVGDVTISGSSDLDVRIDSWAGESREATPQTDGGTEVVLTGFAGTVVVKGTDYSIAANGVMAIKGAGNGSVELAGTGLWRTLGDRGLWPKSIALAA